MRRGSALLIVLGMMAVMVISAVAFSAYMRYSRLPNSYLRRSSSSRMLVKAALAEAIDEIDAAIGNSPHPGVGYESSRYDPDTTSRQMGTSVNRNGWIKRVYLGTNCVNEADAQNKLVEPDTTVSTLTLEGLAYIPPALVNDVRYYSRRSLSARWKRLPFDAGRYAFCAVDVSDHFDVNKLTASDPRNTGPDGRVSMAYLFENNDHTAATGGGFGNPSAWDDFIDNIMQSKVPLVSMADWNLAVHDKKPGGMTSQFCEYVWNGRSSFYGGIMPTSPSADLVRRQTFITDSYFPTESSGNADDDDYDLSDDLNQPFEYSKLSAANPPNLSAFIQNPGREKPVLRLYESINTLGLIQLFDYLDPNKVPLSLGLPTVERVPMICGIQPRFDVANAELRVEPTGDPDITVTAGNRDDSATNQDPQSRDKTYKVTYRISGLSALQSALVSVTAVYPFSHKDGQENDTFTIDGRMSLFFTSSDMGLRTGVTSDPLHITSDGDFQQSGVENGVLRIPLSSQQVNANSFAVKSEKDAVKQYQLMPRNVSNNEDFMTICYKWRQNKQYDAQTGTYSYEPAFRNAEPEIVANGTVCHCHLPPLKSNGAIDERFTNPGSLAALLSSGNAKLKLNAAVWVRVKHNDTVMGEKTVDMVPACVLDDALNGVNNGSAYSLLRSLAGQAYPLMRLDAGVQIDLSPLAPTSGEGKENGPTMDPKKVEPDGGVKAMMVADPRYNFAPECWFTLTEELTPERWLENCHRQDGDRDGDIFMSVSDQGYLQSIYELANLPRLTGFYNGGSRHTDVVGFFGNPSDLFTGRGSNNNLPESFGTSANNGIMWKTYCPFAVGGRAADDFINAGFTTGRNGFRINPYSQSTNILMAAFANTPHDWRCASTNYLGRESFKDTDAAAFNRNYAWNAYSTGAKIEWEDLEDLAGIFMEKMRTGNVTDWESVWRNLGWGSQSGSEASRYLPNRDNQALPNAGNVNASGAGGNEYNIWNCDKKFLYGFWHDCFAAKQQLFLVFVRAEPAMMGGGAVGQTPPSLGARAVALVWRDPRPSPDRNSPHQTRVLFYRQLD